ncbi:TPA: hypothetical protein L3261_004070 [Elizabethkingia anophelis]|uniref:hypothetical protein n=1 Tax=Elizabethkingia anophelis TaxID=1117645 RepID=UPI0029910706|nr:hypothetical protein [Elizabethkingia anophelis]HBN6704416.1 hypothetical protein [Elizabethkingia anophelis]HBN6707090.1 hypothetical protein [Elizabethkingia anophelis]HBN6711124.1 hypothetical protein [Elizabethkingia anophelis]HBN6712579.1 hypothetical protein [Elizabethkingia anophelis]
MKKNTVFNGLVLCGLISVSSCRSTEMDNSFTAGLSSVKINLLGTEYVNSNILAPRASSDKEDSVVDAKSQRQSTLITPSKVLIGELIPMPSAVEPFVSASKVINPTSSISGDKLKAGMKFRVIAYRRDNGSYFTHEDYTIGKRANSLMLSGGIEYDVIIYSFGTEKLPNINESEKKNIKTAKASNTDEDNVDFMYQKIIYTPNGGNSNNTLNFKLNHKLSKITVILKSSFGDISAIQNASLHPHYVGGTISLSNARFNAEYVDLIRPLFSGPFPAPEQVSDPVLINSNDMSTFSADVTLLGYTKSVNLSGFKIPSSTNANLVVNMKTCSAYIAPGVLKEFMCHNLGADTSADPFTPSAAIHGAKYQWGATTDEEGRYLSQQADQFSPSARGWINTDKPNNSWLDTKKTSNDPCPKGYRVPTVADWRGVYNNNLRVERVGTWSFGVNNYGSAIYFGTEKSSRTLMLPVAGERGGLEGALMARGDSGGYWSSSDYKNAGSVDGKAYFAFNKNNVIGNFTGYITAGRSIRCIAE